MKFKVRDRVTQQVGYVDSDAFVYPEDMYNTFFKREVHFFDGTSRVYGDVYSLEFQGTVTDLEIAVLVAGGGGDANQNDVGS